MKIICSCGKVLDRSEDGVNDTEYFVCKKCRKGYNVLVSNVDDEGNPIAE